ncbi:MAG: ABC transporter permease [Deltaproteobacteria bacterium]|nr:ABC transporter permease [Deltaproteobacteria bacterium]
MWLQIKALAIKELQIFIRDPAAVLLVFLLPLGFVVLMSYALAEPFAEQRSRQIHLPVVDLDGGPLASKLLAELDQMEAIAVERRFQGQDLNRKSLEHLIAEGDRSIGLVLPAGLSRALRSRAGDPIAVELVSDPALGDQVVEPLLGTIRGLCERLSFQAFTPDRVDSLFERFGGSMPAIALDGIRNKVRTDVLTSLQTPSPVRLMRVAPASMQHVVRPDAFQQNVPGYTLFGIFWIVVLLAESVLREKRDGTFRRLLAAPLSRGVLLAGKLLPYYLVNLIQIALMLAAGRLIFGLDLGSSPGGLVLVGLAASASATGLGVLVAALVRTEAQARNLTILLLLTLAALGGCFVPRFIMPQAMQSAGLATPHAWALDAFQDILVRGQGVVEILPELGALMAFAAVFFLLGVWRFRFD